MPARVNNNVISMSAGIAGMTKVLTPDAIRAQRAAARRCARALNALCRRHGARLQVTGLASIMSWHRDRSRDPRPADLAAADTKGQDLVFST